MTLLGALIKRGITLGDRLSKTILPPALQQSRTLYKLLLQAQFTRFGKHHKFHKILADAESIKAFQQQVPISDYDDMYSEWWHLNLKNKANVTWPGKAPFYALSSGTSGSPSKYIPLTGDLQRNMFRAGLRMFFSLRKYKLPADQFTRKMLMVGGSTDLQNLGEYQVGDLSGINASKPPSWMAGYYKPGLEIAKINDWDSRIDEIAKNAPQWDIGFISGIPAWVQLTIERVCEYHKVKYIHDIWPNLRVFAHGGVFIEPYKKSFSKLFNKKVHFIDSYLASEGFIAYQNDPDDSSMRMVLNQGNFYEFLPLTAENFSVDGKVNRKAQTLTVEQVEEGVDYALIMSTCGGAWRYLIGDVVRFTDKAHAKIIITGRTKHYLSICGEHLSVDNMNQAIQFVSDKFNIAIPEYTVCGEEAETYFRHHWIIGCDYAADAQLVIDEIDKFLSEVNDDYRTERKSVLKNPVIEIVPTSNFYDFLEQSGKSTGQSKFPRVMKTDTFTTFLDFIKAEAVTK
ncbi:MAG: GH3 auxin-responsive promoter family protein [Saprospiraceae bacterium]